MKTLTAKELIDLARAEPVLIAKHCRPVVVAKAVEEFERLKALEAPTRGPLRSARRRRSEHAA
jgi:hypothetical protein